MDTMNLDELEKLDKARTPGPWHALHMAKGVKPEFRIAGVHSEECKIYHVALEVGLLKETHDRQIADSEAICAAMNAMPGLLKVCRAAESLLSEDGAKEVLAHYVVVQILRDALAELK